MMDKKVIITCGIPGSGKTTWKNKFLKESGTEFVTIHPDSIRKELTGSEEDQSKNVEVFELAFSRLNASLKEGKSVIFDSCAQNKERRRRIIAIAKNNNAKILVVVFNISLELAKTRNSMRDRVVPEFVLDKMHGSWQEPSLSEGIDEIIYKK